MAMEDRKFSGAMTMEDRNYRLRIALPELSQPFLGHWLSPLHQDSYLNNKLDNVGFDMDRQFSSSWFSSDPGDTPSYAFPVESEERRCREDVKSDCKVQVPEIRVSVSEAEGRKRNGYVFHRYTDEFLELQGDGNDCIPTEAEAQHEKMEQKKQVVEMWLHVGKMHPGQPKLRPWELSHELEQMLQQMVLPQALDEVQLGKHELLGGGALLDDAAGNKELRIPLQPSSRAILERDLVRDAIYALQGIPTAVAHLEHLATTFSETSADRTSHSLQTLWLRSSSTTALGKVLAEFAQAGHLACQLEAFVSFFLDEDQQDSAFLFQKGSLEKKSSRTMRRKRKRQNFRSNVELQPKYETIQGNQPVDGGGTSPHCLVNQAFAGAVRTIMQGKLASLNTLGASVVDRRQNTVSGWAGGEFVQVSEDTDPGLVFGFGSGDITLLELYLHTSRLREQFQALAAVCMIDGGIYSTGKYDNRADPEHATERRHGDEGALPPAAGNQCTTVGCAPKPFPRGADLLTYLYEKLSESDPISLELLRFLFERACRPYAGFIQLWLYHATVEDPFEEFIVKCAEGNGMPLSPRSTASGLVSKQTSMSSFQVRTGVSVPSFLEAVCTPLLRAGQQLQVLSKLLETHQFAPHVANFPLLPTGGSQHPSSCSSTIGSEFLNDESSVLTPILHFSKLKLQHVVQQREIRRQVMMERYNCLFADLAQSCLPGEQGEKDRLWQIAQFPSVPKNKLSQKVSDKTEQSIDMLLEGPLKSKLKMDARNLASAALRVEKQADEDVQAGIAQENSDIICGSVETPRTSSAPQHTENKKALVLSMGFHDKLSHCSYPDARASLISDFRRGTSWPLCGLPSNPFLPSNKTRTSTHAYTHTVFHDKDRHWDIAMHWGDPMRFFPSESSLFDGMEGFVEDKSGPISCHGVAAVRPDWFTRLEESFHYQLFRGLDAQILQEQFGNLGFESDREDVGDHNPYGTMSKDWANYMSPGSLTPLLERNSWRHLQPNPEWEEVVESAAVDAYGNCYFVEECVSPKAENIKLINPHDETDSLGGLGVINTGGKCVDPSLFGLLQSGRDSCGKSCETIAESLDTLSAPKEIMPSEDSKLLDSMDNHQKTTKSSAETDTIASSESMGAASAGSGGSGRGASWQTYLGAGSREHVRQLPDMQYEAATACEDGDDSDEEIPLVVVVDQCLVQEILSQYPLSATHLLGSAQFLDCCGILTWTGPC